MAGVAPGGYLRPMSLAVKSGRPPSCDGLVRRERLLARLAEHGQTPVVVLAAPAGYGKTTLVAQWLEHEARPVRWLALEPWHDDPRALAHAIETALGDVGPAAGSVEAALGDSGNRGARGSGERWARGGGGARAGGFAATVLAPMAEAIEAMEPFVLVLDDLDAIGSAPALQVPAMLAEHLPHGAQLVLAARARPALALGRLRAHRALLELEADDLAMSEREAASLLGLLGVELSERQLRDLMARTEGWTVAIYLAALALREQDDVQSALGSFGGEDVVVAEYLRDELLCRVSARERRLLVETSVCGPLSGDLCDAILETSGSARMLASLERGPLPLRAVDRAGERYRCHPLLRELLRAELRHAGRRRESHSHARARAWHEANGDFDCAAAHAIAAHDARAAGETLWRHLPDYIPVGRNDVLREHLSGLTSEEIGSTPTLAVTAAHSALALGDLRQAERWALAGAAALADAPETPAAATLRAGIAVIEASVSRGVQPMGREAAKACALEDEHGRWRSSLGLLLGVSAQLVGDRAGAREHLQDAAYRSGIEAPSVEALCLAQLALLSDEEGDAETALELAASACELVREHDLSTYPTTALAFAVAADVRLRAGLVEEGGRDAARASELLGKLGDFIPWYGAQARIALARAQVRLGDVAAARALLAEASRLARRVSDAVVLRRRLEDAWGEVDGAAGSALSGPAALTLAELRILRFLPTHLSFREIGERLHVSTNTVKTQAHSVYRKLEVSSRSDAVARASQIGLLAS